jgi:anti-sigma factor RsiW
MNEHIPAEDFAAYVDGMLRPEKRNELENHFARCPACLDELVEIAAIMSGRDKVLAGNRGKIPAEFLKLALGEKNKTAKSVLHLRLVFEVAAAFVVVIFIGYLFLSGNRFWQTSEQMKPSVVTNKNVHLAEPAASFRDRVDARKTKSEQVEADAGLELDDSSVPSKRENAVVEKSLPAGRGNSLRKTNCKKSPRSSRNQQIRKIVCRKKNWPGPKWLPKLLVQCKWISR